MNAILIEEHPLLRLGLLQMLENIHGTGNALAISPDNIPQSHTLRQPPDLLVFGMPADTAAGWRQLDEVRAVFAPNRILVLADELPLRVPSGSNARDICGCLPKSASLAVIEAAIHMASSGTQGMLLNADAGPAVSTPAAHMGGAVHGGMPTLAACATPVRNGNVVGLAASTQASGAAAMAASEAEMTAYDEAEMLKITPRQYEVLVLLARGYPIKTVSRMLNISVATVKSHACTLYQRLKVRNKGEAVYAALQRGATLEWVSGDQHFPRDHRADRPAPFAGSRPIARRGEATLDVVAAVG